MTEQRSKGPLRKRYFILKPSEEISPLTTVTIQLKAPQKGNNPRPVGMHVSISGHLHNAIDRALEVGCVRTFQIFTCSPQRWKASLIDEDEAKIFREKTRANNFEPFCHMPYLPNLCSPDPKIYSQSLEVLIREVNRCEQLGITFLVLHFGSHSGTSIAEGHNRLIDACKSCFKKTKDSKVRLLLENSAGVRNSVGSDFHHIRYVIERIGDSERTGVCFDTCHAFASGYDLSNAKSVADSMEKFDTIVGRDNLRLIHINDSKGGLGGATDRHENIGQGSIGLAGFKALIGLKELVDVPLILETPVKKEGDDKINLKVIKSLLA